MAPTAVLVRSDVEYPFESHRLDLDGVGLHYVDEGPREAAPILFVHGNPTWSFFWRHPIRAFRDAYRCVAVGHASAPVLRRAFGYSPNPGQGPVLPRRTGSVRRSGISRALPEIEPPARS